MRRALAAAFLFTAALCAGAQDFSELRSLMVRDQIQARGITDRRVLDAMREVERHLFVPESLRSHSYEDSPLPIGEGQTISQPYIVALMTESLRLTGAERVLEVGTGSGYQAAVLSRLVKEVFTIEIKPTLQERAATLLSSLRLGNVNAMLGDGWYGWQEKAPFDRIMITAAVGTVPPPLLAQLVDGGLMVLPLGNPFTTQTLVRLTKKGSNYTVEYITGVLFVPMTGKALSGVK
jgi:protein-L-isoaspartate(D-aspartate) O-methyltransferase